MDSTGCDACVKSHSVRRRSLLSKTSFGFGLVCSLTSEICRRDFLWHGTIPSGFATDTPHMSSYCRGMIGLCNPQPGVSLPLLRGGYSRGVLVSGSSLCVYCMNFDGQVQVAGK